MGTSSRASVPPRRSSVVVIGSGFGGAVTACRRAQAGDDVVVLERGRRLNRHDFPRTFGQFGRAFWDERTGDGFLDYRAFKKVDVIAGVGVGGGSLHYFNVNVPAPHEVFDRPGWPAALDRSTLDPYYELARCMLGSQPLVTPPPGETDLPPRTKVFDRAARTAGHDAEPVSLAVHLGERRSHPISGQLQEPCNYCGNCLLGCDRGAKNTLDHNYLALAEQHGAQIVPGCTATRLSPAEGGGYRVDYQMRLDDGEVEARWMIGDEVVVAAGSLGSTELLLRCRDQHRSLPDLGPALGSRFSVNGEFLLAYADGADTAVEPGVGPPITRMVRASRDGHELSVQDLGLPERLLWFLEGAAPPTAVRVRRIASLIVDYGRRSLGLGGRTSRIGLQLDAIVSGARSPHALPFLGMGTERGAGRLRLDRQRLRVDWRPSGNKEMYRELQSLMAELSRSAGAAFVTSPLWRWPARKVLTAHPLGGCPIGADPATGVVDDRGECFAYPGLFVIDGSMIPAALAVNPSLTIAALAERSAFVRAHGRELTAADPYRPDNQGGGVAWST